MSRRLDGGSKNSNVCHPVLARPEVPAWPAPEQGGGG
jgi:hypothetical protein